MEALVNPNTFCADHLVRDKMGSPIGRAILVTEDAYKAGQDFYILMLCVPISNQGVLGSYVYVDGLRYQVPQSMHSFRVNKRDSEWVVSSFTLKRVPHES